MCPAQAEVARRMSEKGRNERSRGIKHSCPAMIPLYIGIRKRKAGRARALPGKEFQSA